MLVHLRLSLASGSWAICSLNSGLFCWLNLFLQFCLSLGCGLGSGLLLVCFQNLPWLSSWSCCWLLLSCLIMIQVQKNWYWVNRALFWWYFLGIVHNFLVSSVSVVSRRGGWIVVGNLSEFEGDDRKKNILQRNDYRCDELFSISGSGWAPGWFNCSVLSVFFKPARKLALFQPGIPRVCLCRWWPSLKDLAHHQLIHCPAQFYWLAFNCHLFGSQLR